MSITICDTHLTRTVRYLSLTFEPVYYFLNCHKGMEDSKIKVMIESDGVIQMLEKRVETISDDGWKKIIEDFQKLHENEERMERNLKLKNFKERKKRFENYKKKLINK